MTSVGLAVGCGDDGTMTSQTGAGTMTTMTTASTSVGTMTATTVDATESSTQPPTTSEGSGSMTSDSSGTTAEPTSSTGMITATGSTSTMGTTDETTTDVSGTETGSTSMDTTSTSTSTSTSDGTSSSGGSSSSTSTTDMSGTTMDIPCDQMSVVLTPVVPNVMLVLDKSGSMVTNTWDHDADPNTMNVTRWYSLYAVVDQILTAFQADFNFGMNLFPNKTATSMYDSTACPVSNNVEVTVKPNNKAAIMAALPAQNNITIKGGTPASTGVTRALTHLKTLDPMVPRIIMLITDGAANCGAGLMGNALFEQYDQTLHTVVGNAYTNDDIPTYVIGIAITNAVTEIKVDGNPDNINPYEKLNELATLGGTAKAGPEKFYSADNQIELAAALNAIVSDAQSCIIALEAEPGFPAYTKVKVGNDYLMKINDCANEDGWKYVDPAPPYNAIELCGTACDALKNTGEAGVEYFCMPG